MEIIGFFCAVIMGVVLGMIGGGGSILAVPILVYIFRESAATATGYSLFIVGLGALFGAFTYTKRGQLNFRVGVIFAFPALIGVYITRLYLIPSLPEIVHSFSSLDLTKDMLIMLVFALVMLMASYSMIRGRKSSEAVEKKTFNYPLIAVEGVIVGAVTGFVGAGGGFLIIPALVVLAGLEMKTAVGTSLAIIAVKSLIGFLGDVQVNPNIDWNFLGMFSALAIAGIFIGTYFSQKIHPAKLKKGFGYFVLVMGVFILAQQFFRSY